MCQNWRLLELTNGNIGAVAVNAFVPIGAITRKVAKEPRCTPTFEAGTTLNNIVTISEKGIYNITYTGTLTAAAAGTLTLNLLADSAVIATRSVTATEGSDVNIALSKEVRVFGNCCNGVSPVIIALQIADTAITGGNGTIIINRQADV